MSRDELRAEVRRQVRQFRDLPDLAAQRVIEVLEQAGVLDPVPQERTEE